jgi:hypothetical protein
VFGTGYFDADAIDVIGRQQRAAGTSHVIVIDY